MKKLLLLLSILGISTAHAQFPEGFEGTTFPPAGWASYVGTNGLGTLQNWAFYGGTGNFATGLQCARSRYENVANPNFAEDWLVTPLVAITATNKLLTFSDRQQYIDVYNSTYTIKVSTTSQTNIASFTNVSSGTEADLSITTFTGRSVDLTAFIGQSIYVAFVHATDDGDDWLLDDVNFTVPASCPTPTAGLSTVDSPTQATLSWTSANPNFEVLVQLASAAAPIATAPDGTGVNVVGNSYVATLATANSAYSYYVRAECSPAFEYSTWAGPFNFNNVTAPDCAVLTLPLDAATDVTVILSNSTVTPTTRNAAILLNWTAPATPVAGYRIVFGTDPAALPTLNPAPAAPFTGVAVNITGVLYNTTYYWRIVPVTATGIEATGCATFSFTTQATPGFCMNGVLSPTATYTPAVCNGTTANVITPVAIRAGRYSNVNVISGETYTFGSSVATDFMSLSTDGGLTSAGAGTTPYTWTSNFTGAIRVYAHLSNLCGASLSTSTRTTTVICSNNLANDTFTSVNFKSFPNPIKDVLNLSYDKNITSVSVMNLLGQVVLTNAVENKEAKIDMSSLTTGTYMVKVTSDNEVKTIKVIKE